MTLEAKLFLTATFMWGGVVVESKLWNLEPGGTLYTNAQSNMPEELNIKLNHRESLQNVQFTSTGMTPKNFSPGK